MAGRLLLLSMVIILASLSVYQSYVILSYQYYMDKMVWGLQTLELNYLYTRDGWRACEEKRWTKM